MSEPDILLADAAPRQRVPSLGAIVTPSGVVFRVWSTRAKSVEVIFYDAAEREERRPLTPVGNDVYEAFFADVKAGQAYKFSIGGPAFPDPYARSMPQGPHGASVVWQSSYHFKHRAPELRPSQLVIYELHVGTFTPQGTYRAAAAKLPYLKDLGVNCIEMMPISSFAGQRGWGYDGVAHFAPFAGYGPPEDLQAFVDEAHAQGLVVLLDMVLNHFGPDGNYLSAYSPEYFTSAHKTPWGDALNYTNPFMRRLALDSAEHWLHAFRLDGFRLDATHEIFDDGELHVLEELAQHVHRLQDVSGTPHFLFCEDDRNWPGLVTRFKMDGMWSDDFHHQLRIVLTGERDGYFGAYDPSVSALARCITRGWTYEGQTWAIGKPRARGNPATELLAANLVYTIQNHDQIGNRALGDRLQIKAGTDGFLLASALLLFLPMTPLIFQGQEWMTKTPFLYFSDHGGELGRAITKGRIAEFGHFESFQNDAAVVPDPQAEQTFLASKLDWHESAAAPHADVLNLYKQLLHLRQTDSVLANGGRQHLTAGSTGDVLWVVRHFQGPRRLLMINFGHEAVAVCDVNSSTDGGEIVLSLAGATCETLPGRSALICKFS